MTNVSEFKTIIGSGTPNKYFAKFLLLRTKSEFKTFFRSPDAKIDFHQYD